MPTIYTGTADIPFQAGYKAGKTARQMYEEEKAREDARLKAQLDSQREHLNFTKQKAEYEHLEMLAKLAQEKVKSETELMLNNKSADDKRKQWALEKIYDKYGSNTDLNNPEIQKEFLNTYVNSKQIFDTDLSWAERGMQQQPQGQPPTPDGVIDDSSTKPLTVEEQKNKEKLTVKLENRKQFLEGQGVDFSDVEDKPLNEQVEIGNKRLPDARVDESVRKVRAYKQIGREEKIMQEKQQKEFDLNALDAKLNVLEKTFYEIEPGEGIYGKITNRLKNIAAKTGVESLADRAVFDKTMAAYGTQLSRDLGDKGQVAVVEREINKEMIPNSNDTLTQGKLKLKNLRELIDATRKGNQKVIEDILNKNNITYSIIQPKEQSTETNEYTSPSGVKYSYKIKG